MELVAGIAVLLLPVVMLVVTLPEWVARQHAATVAAREGARVLARDFASATAHDVDTAVGLAAAAHGLPAGTARVVAVEGARVPGSVVTVRVVVSMPVTVIPGLGPVGGWSTSASASRRIDDYRSW